MSAVSAAWFLWLLSTYKTISFHVFIPWFYNQGKKSVPSLWAWRTEAVNALIEKKLFPLLGMKLRPELIEKSVAPGAAVFGSVRCSLGEEGTSTQWATEQDFREINLYGSSEPFTFGLSPGEESDKPSMAQQYPALPKSIPYQDLPSPCFLCAGHFLNASFNHCHCN